MDFPPEEGSQTSRDEHTGRPRFTFPLPCNTSTLVFTTLRTWIVNQGGKTYKMSDVERDALFNKTHSLFTALQVSCALYMPFLAKATIGMERKGNVPKNCGIIIPLLMFQSGFAYGDWRKKKIKEASIQALVESNTNLGNLAIMTIEDLTYRSPESIAKGVKSMDEFETMVKMSKRWIEFSDRRETAEKLRLRNLTVDESGIIINKQSGKRWTGPPWEGGEEFEVGQHHSRPKTVEEFVSAQGKWYGVWGDQAFDQLTEGGEGSGVSEETASGGEGDLSESSE
eukprot:GHVN01021898.1.p1 GENE.GHVN01021898.1~~GHVN01021898.1.p1  ORF type:complete len:283 (+),score=45.88 GHVN01021898.1:114-962(+)